MPQPATWEWIDPDEFNFRSADNVTSFEVKGTLYRFCGEDSDGRVLRYLKSADTMLFVTEELDLVEGVKLVKAADYKRELRNVLMGARVVSKTECCIVDRTNSDGLNVNFTRVISILPLVMQVKSFNKASIFVSLGIIFMDLTSVWWNKVWVCFKTGVFYYTKRGLSFLCRNPRVRIHHFLASGADSFMYCDKTMHKSHWKELSNFICLRGCQIPENSDTVDSLQAVGMVGNMVGGTVTEVYIINKSEHVVKTTLDQQTGLYTIEVTDCEGVHVRRVRAPLSDVYKMRRFFEILEQTGTWPVAEIRGKTIYVVSPCVSIRDGTYDYAVQCTLFQREKMFVS